MKKIYLCVCLFVVASFSLSSQNMIDKKGKQGVWIKYYDNGNLMYEGTFKNDVPMGEFKRYHENGKVKSKQFFSPTTTEVPTELYRKDAKLFASGVFDGKKKKGEWLYYSSKGYLVLTETYNEAGNRDGISYLYDENKRIFQSVEWKNGNIHGKLKQFFPNEKLQSEITYVNGLKHGPFRAFFDNEQIESAGMFVDGKKEGFWVFNKSDGTLDFSIEYKKGIPVNQKELLEQQQEELLENDENAGKIKDPADYVKNPEEYIYNIR